jgi:hypothetical protein
VKRSRAIRLVLVGSLATGAWSGCEPGRPAPVSAAHVYTNNYYVPGVGYYHAPFRAFYQVPYNFYEPKSQKYFFGGQWASAPHLSITNISAPPAEIAQLAEAQRTDIARGGFGSSARHHHVWS